jgi:murein DD-endopeptidase MepM/ murein hydrolase activator NlpD
MKQSYFILVVAHSLHGRLRRIYVPHSVIYAVLALALLGFFSVVGAVSSYARMVWKVSHYNHLRQETESLRMRYQNLQKVLAKTNEQLASLQLFAREVSVSYGIQSKMQGTSRAVMVGDELLPSYNETLAEYNFLKTANLGRMHRQYAKTWQVNVAPSIWPLEGRLMSSFGARLDPFSGEGAFHAGVDISAPNGSPVKATGDGVVSFADRVSGYGRMVVIDHGSGVSTRYAHLSRIDVLPGQEVRRGSQVGQVGTSGRATGPHLHYEVRVGGSPVNPHKYLKSTFAKEAKSDLPF